MAHVLMGFAEALAAPEAFFSLYHAGHQVSVFAREGARNPILNRLPLVGIHWLPAPECNAPAAIKKLDQTLKKVAPDAVLPLDDPGLWLADRVIGCDSRLAGGIGDATAVALDKARQITAARTAGLTPPETIVVSTHRDLENIKTLPAIAKPALTVGLTADGTRLTKSGVTYLPDMAAVQALHNNLEASIPPLLVQPLIHGVGEGVFGFAGAHGVCNFSGHRRLRMMNPHGSGSSACRTIPINSELQTAVARFVTAIGWRGPFMVELLRDIDGTPWFMELNGRMWGSLALARAQGFEYPAWAVDQVLDPKFEPTAVTPRTESLTARHLGRDLLHLAFVARGPKSEFHRQGWPRLLSSLADVLRPANRTYNTDPAFPNFAWRDALHTVWRHLHR